MYKYHVAYLTSMPFSYIRWIQSHVCCLPCFLKNLGSCKSLCCIMGCSSGCMLEMVTRVVYHLVYISFTTYYLLLFHQEQYTISIQYRVSDSTNVCFLKRTSGFVLSIITRLHNVKLLAARC